MSHIQFSRDSRIELAVLLATGHNQAQCARRLGMHRSSISKEIKHNRSLDGVYREGYAHRQAKQRRSRSKVATTKIRNDLKLKRYIVGKLKKFWSPEQIAGRLYKIHGETIVCYETIYQFIYADRPKLTSYLRRQKNKYRKKRGTKARLKLNKASKIRRIEDRPLLVETRERLGDWGVILWWVKKKHNES